ncbi:nitroreductase/quinone reductase family protein [Streptomyces sp. NPDC059740]|uniref:nitroreductase/quinone reductase family protein n=1 Tax=Streptomyces sp. NPDC059740 TaxID=3346926 RepID=UPI003669D4CC
MTGRSAGATARLHRKLLLWVGYSGLLRRWGPRLLPRLDLWTYRRTNGRWMPSRLLRPVAVLHTVSRDGTPRLTPLLADRDSSGGFLVVATNFGRTRHPRWSDRLLRDPRAVINWRGTSVRVRARQLTPQEQDAARGRILQLMPPFDAYAERSHRKVRVFLLTPLTSGEKT